MKKRVNVSIDKELHDQVLKSGMNFSEFVETITTEYFLGKNRRQRELLNSKQKIIDSISKKYSQLEVLNTLETDLAKEEKNNTEKINKEWKWFTTCETIQDSEYPHYAEIFCVEEENVDGLKQLFIEYRNSNREDKFEMYDNLEYFKKVLKEEMDLEL